MDWRSDYKRKCTTAQKAVTHIHSGDRVLISHAVAEPTALVDAMVDNAAAYRNVEIIHMVAMGESRYCAPEYADNFRHNSLFVGNSTRQAVKEDRGDYTPVFFSEIPLLLRTRLVPDVVLFNLSPPDENGYCSYGVSVDYTKPGAECARLRIAQINRHMPRTCGDTRIHVKDLDVIVEADIPLIELAAPTLSEVELAIGRNVASLVKDGDTLQLGIGAIPDAVLASLGNKRDLGIHSEMFSDGVVDLVRSGVITNARKNYMPGKIVATFLMGTQKLYDFVDGNPDIEMLPVEEVNDPYIAAQNDNLVSINSCVQVDLMGQVVSDSVGPMQISGVGGQVDFVRAAALSRGGRSILAMPSTVRNRISKIVPFIDHGAAVTTSRYDVDYVATEYGIVRLKQRTLRERAEALISIAHPAFRPALREEYHRRFPRAAPLQDVE